MFPTWAHLEEQMAVDSTTITKYSEASNNGLGWEMRQFGTVEGYTCRLQNTVSRQELPLTIYDEDSSKKTGIQLKHAKSTILCDLLWFCSRSKSCSFRHPWSLFMTLVCVKHVIWDTRLSHFSCVTIKEKLGGVWGRGYLHWVSLVHLSSLLLTWQHALPYRAGIIRAKLN